MEKRQNRAWNPEQKHLSSKVRRDRLLLELVQRHPWTQVDLEEAVAKEGVSRGLKGGLSATAVWSAVNYYLDVGLFKRLDEGDRGRKRIVAWHLYSPLDQQIEDAIMEWRVAHFDDPDLGDIALALNLDTDDREFCKRFVQVGKKVLHDTPEIDRLLEQANRAEGWNNWPLEELRQMLRNALIDLTRGKMMDFPLDYELS
jgi:hypothetical protein